MELFRKVNFYNNFNHFSEISIKYVSTKDVAVVVEQMLCFSIEIKQKPVLKILINYDTAIHSLLVEYSESNYNAERIKA